MTRKAKLDILEIHAEERPADQEPAPPPESEPESPLPLPPRFRLHKKLVVLCAIALIGCCIVGGSAYFWLRAGKQAASSPADNGRSPAVLAATRHPVVTLDKFMIDYRGQGDTVRIAVFALAVELDESVKKQAVENQPELRGEIYALSKKRSVDSLRSSAERGALKNEIAAELEKRLGAGSVKAVFFTTFYIL